MIQGGDFVNVNAIDLQKKTFLLKKNRLFSGRRNGNDEYLRGKIR